MPHIFVFFSLLCILSFLFIFFLGVITRYPDDPFDRFWGDFGGVYSTEAGNRNVSVSGFWNLPPLKIFETALTNNGTQPMEWSWPPVSLPESKYYIALYFADARNWSSRKLDISINNISYYRNLNVTAAGACVFATTWPLAGPTKITLTPTVDSNVGPLINAGEIFSLLSLGGRTATRDGMLLSNCIFRKDNETGVICGVSPTFSQVFELLVWQLFEWARLKYTWPK